MAAAIAICIAGFVAIYVQLQPFISDFVSQDPPGQESRVIARPDPTEAPADDEEDAAPDAEPAEDEEPPEDEPEEEAPAEEEEPEPTEEPEGFDPDLQSNSESQINLRAEPNTSSEILTVLTVAQPIESTGETAPANNPEQDGDLWVQVQTEDDLQGWMREIDTEPFQE